MTTGVNVRVAQMESLDQILSLRIQKERERKIGKAEERNSDKYYVP